VGTRKIKIKQISNVVGSSARLALSSQLFVATSDGMRSEEKRIEEGEGDRHAEFWRRADRLFRAKTAPQKCGGNFFSLGEGLTS
jgi:hypothetical protein